MSNSLMILAAAAAQVAANATAEAPVVVAPSAGLLEWISPVFLLLWAAALCAITAVIHSVLGEQRLIRPMLAERAGIFDSSLARQVSRFAWHWTSVLWLLVGAALAAAAYGDITNSWLVIAIGVAHVLAGLADAALTRGQHIGWPLITLIGALTLWASYLNL